MCRVLRQKNLSWAGKLKSLAGFGVRVLHAFNTDQMQSSYQALEIFSSVSRSLRGNVPAMAIPWRMQGLLFPWARASAFNLAATG